MSGPLVVASALVKVARRVWDYVPGRVRKHLEDRVYYAIFHTTRVTNDAYGWRPPPPPGDAPG